MAEFGVKATDLQDPQGRGSATVAPVQEPASSWSLPNLGGLFTGLKTKDDSKPWTGAVNEYYKKLTGIQQAVDTGQYDQRRAANMSRQLGIEYAQKIADFGPEAHKALQDSRAYASGLNVGVEQMDTLAEKDLTQQYNIAEGLQKAGVYVPPLAEQSQADRDMLNRQAAHLAQMDRLAKEAKEAVEWDRSLDADSRAKQKFSWEARQQSRMEDAQNSLAAMKRDSLNYIPTMIENIQKLPLSQQEKAAMFEQSVAGLGAVASDMLIGDSAALSNYQTTVKGVSDIGREMFKDGADLTKLQNELQKRLIGGQLSLLDAGGSPALQAAAADRLFPNVPAVSMAASSGLLRMFKDDLIKAASGNVVPSILTNDINTQKHTFATIKNTVNSAVMNGESASLDAAAQAANSTLRTLGSVSANNPVSLEYTKDFIASPEYGELIKAGKYDADAADMARPAFQDLYLDSFGKKMFADIGKPIGDINYVNGQPSEDNATLGQIFDFQMDKSGKMKAINTLDAESRKTITASDLFINRQIREAQKLADSLNTVVRAGAHLDGRTDYGQYWEENKHLLVRGMYPPPDQVEAYSAETGYIGTGSALNPRNYKRTDGTSTTD